MSKKQKYFLLAAASFSVLVLAAIAMFLYRPARLLGIDGNRLGTSISRAIGRHAQESDCVHGVGEPWRCSILIEPDIGSGGSHVDYVADSDEWGCWHAHPQVQPRRKAIRLTGCIDVFDVLLPE